MIIIQLLAFITGIFGVLVTINSALRTFVVPRSTRDHITRVVFVLFRRFLNIGLRRMASYEQRDTIMAYYAPIALLLLLPVWYILITFSYGLMYWALGHGNLEDCFLLSGSSLLTLGFASADTTAELVLVFSEATIGLLLVALLIAYLPTIYSAFRVREFQVTRLEIRAGSPPSPVEFILRHHRLNRLDTLTDVWKTWEEWFTDVTESHTSLAVLVFFRSPTSDKSWLTSAGVVMDTAALIRSTIDVPVDRQADICIRAGYLALRRISDFFGIPYNADARFPTDLISISREEFDEVYDIFQAEGIKLKEREQAWMDYAGWRVNYDAVLIALARLTMAPFAMWSSDRLEERDNVFTPRLRI